MRAKTELVRSMGADHAIDHTREDFADGVRGYDVILDTAGRRGVATLQELLVSGEVVPVVDRSFAPEDVPEAIRCWEEDPTGGKIFRTI